MRVSYLRTISTRVSTRKIFYTFGIAVATGRPFYYTWLHHPVELKVTFSRDYLHLTTTNSTNRFLIQ